MFKRRRRRKKRSSVFTRIAKSIIAIIILTSLILGVSFFIKEAVYVDTSKLAQISDPLFKKLGVDSSKAGEVAGQFIQRISDTDLNISNNVNSANKSSILDDESVSKDSKSANDPNQENSKDQGNILAFGSSTSADQNSNNTLTKVAIMSDVEGDFDNLEQALNIAKENNVEAVFFIGDYTELGVLDDLESAKQIMDSSDMDYYSIPGDRDLWKTVGPDNFLKVFDENYYSVNVGGYKFVMLDNSANYTAVESTQLQNFFEDVEFADFVMLATPLYHPTNSRVMGYVSDEEIAELIDQSEQILDAVRESNVKAIFAAEHHFFTQNVDPQKNSLTHIVNGALASSRNLQTPQFSILTVLENGSFDVEAVRL